MSSLRGTTLGSGKSLEDVSESDALRELVVELHLDADGRIVDAVVVVVGGRTVVGIARIGAGVDLVAVVEAVAVGVLVAVGDAVAVGVGVALIGAAQGLRVLAEAVLVLVEAASVAVVEVIAARRGEGDERSACEPTAEMIDDVHVMTPFGRDWRCVGGSVSGSAPG